MTQPTPIDLPCTMCVAPHLGMRHLFYVLMLYLSSTVHIPFPAARLAKIALRALAVDEELSPLVHRAFFVEPSTASPAGFSPSPRTGGALHLAIDQQRAIDKEGSVLVTQYSATTNRMLRVAVNGFFESLGVVMACIRELDVEVVDADWIGDGNEEVDMLRRVQGLEEQGTIG